MFQLFKVHDPNSNTEDKFTDGGKKQAGQRRVTKVQRRDEGTNADELTTSEGTHMD